jgi:ribose transport system substrate-binding protein/inositol transport system substrate-binding protein
MRKATLALLTLLALPALAEPAAARTKIFVTMAKTDKFLGILRDQMVAEAAKDPDLDVTVVVADNDPAKQLAQVNDAIADHAAAIIVLAVNGDTAKAVGAAAGKAGTPLIYLNRLPPIDRFSGPVSIVASNDLVAGRLQGRLIAEHMGDTGNVVILRGEDGHPAAAQRTQGVKEILSQRPGIRIIEEATGNWKREEGERLVTQWLQKGEPINAILANNDEMAIGAITALQKAKIPPGKIFVAGVDGTTDALDAMRSGYLTLSLLQSAKAQAVHALDDAKKFAGKQYAELYDWVPYELIIPSNLSQYAGQ